MKVPFLSLEHVNKQIQVQVKHAFEEVFESNMFILGSKLKDFEVAYASYNNVRFCAGVSNGLDALHLALKALNIGPGDEVIVPSNTFIATILAVSYVGAKPVLVEPHIDTYNIDSNRIQDSITENTKAIMPVHLYGQCCDMESIDKIARENNLFVVEDNAQAQGATCNGKMAGSFGDINGTSFYPGKNLGALGDAGAITTDNERLFNRVLSLRNYGSARKYYNDDIGFNMRMDELQAAFLKVKLGYLQQWTIERQKIAAWYTESLKGVGDLILPMTSPKCTHVYHLYVIRTNERDKLREFMEKAGIDSIIHYPVPPHLQAAYKSMGYKKGDFPISEVIADTCISLPIWPGLSYEMVAYVSSQIKSFFNG